MRRHWGGCLTFESCCIVGNSRVTRNHTASLGYLNVTLLRAITHPRNPRFGDCVREVEARHRRGIEQHQGGFGCHRDV